ncbi:MAG: hypothetical protein WC974_04495 [Thermoplasmata archaeon]
MKSNPEKNIIRGLIIDEELEDVPAAVVEAEEAVEETEFENTTCEDLMD